MKNLIISISLLFSLNTVMASYTITRQGQLNNFQFNKVIYGDLILTTSVGQDSSKMIYDLSPLLHVDTIFGSLGIHHSALTNFSGLRNLVVTGGLYIYENEGLKDLSTLDGPKEVESIKIYQNPKLKTCSTFSYKLTCDYIRIYENQSLELVDLKLDSFTVTWRGTYSITVSKNTILKNIRVSEYTGKLRSLTILENDSLTSIHVNTISDSLAGIFIWLSPLLKNVTGFSNVKYVYRVDVNSNPSLKKLCFLKQILEKEGIGYLSLFANGQGANTEAEVLNTNCTDFNTGIGEVNGFEALALYPNPAQNEVYITAPSQRTSYYIYDVSGKLVRQGLVETSGRIGLATISNGMYVLMVDNKRSKLVVQ